MHAIQVIACVLLSIVSLYDDLSAAPAAAWTGVRDGGLSYQSSTGLDTCVDSCLSA